MTNVEVISLNEFNKIDIIEPITSYSTSTTTTNSIELCNCHQINTDLNCKNCCQPTFDLLGSFKKEHDEVKERYETILSEYKQVQTKKESLAAEIVKINQTTLNKQNEIESTRNKIESLKLDLKVLEIKCKEEKNQIADIQTSKENVKKEIEDLTQKLFEEANNLIQIEKAQQAVIKAKNDQLELELTDLKPALEEATAQLNLIRTKMNTEEADDTQKTCENDNVIMDTYSRAQLDFLLMHKLNLQVDLDLIQDDAALMDFNDFILSCQQASLRAINSLKYMKYLIKEDVYPCLRFGPNPKLAAKKIMDAILVKTCFIEECPEGFVIEQAERQLKEEASATLWERFTSSSVFLGCQACGRTMEKESRPTVLKYRFRVSYFDEWACIDRYCRDRLLAVMELYQFIRQLRSGLYKHRSLHELYQQFLRLRLQMFISRMGSLPNVLLNCGIHPDKIATTFESDVNLQSSSSIERLSSSAESAMTISTVESSTFSS